MPSLFRPTCAPAKTPVTRGRLKSFWQSEQGATAIEYALIASLIAVVIVGAVTALGGSVEALFTTTAEAIN